MPLFAVETAPPYLPEASFKFKSRVLDLRLKDRFWAIVRNDIKAGIGQFGSDTELYWAHVRRLALRYWRDWDRREIFDINPHT